MSRSVFFRILLVLLVGLVIGGEAAYLALRQPDSDAPSPEALHALQAQLGQRTADLEFVRRQLDMAEGELAVERSAGEALAAQVDSQLDQLGTLRDRLAFYEQLLPPTPGGVVSVRGLDIEQTAEGLRYRVLLMRSVRNGSPPFVGSLQFVAEGAQDGKPKTLVLSLLRPASPSPAAGAEPVNSAGAGATSATAPAVAGGASATPAAKAEDGPATATPVADDAKAPLPPDTIPFDFDQYQRGQGLLGLPKGFVPASITLNVLEGGVVRATRTVKGPF
ncbi:hypothetical protein CAL29_27395 [Bordetella genomosp. 10]|uniref:Uncharacterized protein n=1 Tax=Bordetella genomosp. 10 TaxID=1416804 RepID=A0A261S385_9BORD|nr:DUF6776 family protein [Bordetella genomosp. 10]OZI31611.1 hypothetical protein CAL29_27395 [Bordetella genomosp. 10]